MTLAAFIAGFLFGVTAGIAIMCLMAVADDRDEDDY